MRSADGRPPWWKLAMLGFALSYSGFAVGSTAVRLWRTGTLSPGAGFLSVGSIVGGILMGPLVAAATEGCRRRSSHPEVCSVLAALVLPLPFAVWSWLAGGLPEPRELATGWANISVPAVLYVWIRFYLGRHRVWGF
jgi:hypothetical protein